MLSTTLGECHCAGSRACNEAGNPWKTRKNRSPPGGVIGPITPRIRIWSVHPSQTVSYGERFCVICVCRSELPEFFCARSQDCVSWFVNISEGKLARMNLFPHPLCIQETDSEFFLVNPDASYCMGVNTWVGCFQSNLYPRERSAIPSHPRYNPAMPMTRFWERYPQLGARETGSVTVRPTSSVSRATYRRFRAAVEHVVPSKEKQPNPW